MNREEAQVKVDAVTYLIDQYKAVSTEDVLILIGAERLEQMQHDPIRKLGPTAETFYPWNVVDYIVG